MGGCPPKEIYSKVRKEVTPTLKENKRGCRNDKGQDGKREEERNRQHGEGGKQQQGLSNGGVAEEVLARSGAEQLRNLLMRQN